MAFVRHITWLIIFSIYFLVDFFQNVLFIVYGRVERAEMASKWERTIDRKWQEKPFYNHKQTNKQIKQIRCGVTETVLLWSLITIWRRRKTNEMYALYLTYFCLNRWKKRAAFCRFFTKIINKFPCL